MSDFTWSHDGTQALISYRDGFVLVGSVSGQRHWSSEINLESQITCGIWTPDDQQVTTALLICEVGLYEISFIFSQKSQIGFCLKLSAFHLNGYFKFKMNQKACLIN